MQTYHYKFPAEGNIVNEDQETDLVADKAALAEALGKKLDDGPSCLMSYCVFPTDGVAFDRLSLAVNDEGNVEAIDVYTYSKLWDGMEDDFKDCLNENLAEASLELYGDEQRISVTGDVEFLGREGDIPKKLYFIASEKKVDKILKEGIIPNIGANNYKNLDNKVFLTSMDDAAAWLAVLKHKDNARLIEVDTEGLNFEMGRMFNDRGFVQGGKYTEYTTTETVPVSAVKQADFGKGSNELAVFIRNDMIEQLHLAADDSEIAEVKTGLTRLAGMGLMKEDQVDALVEQHKNLLKEYGSEVSKVYDEQDDTPPWDENDDGKDPNWEKEAGEDLEQAMRQMTLADFGFKID